MLAPHTSQWILLDQSCKLTEQQQVIRIEAQIKVNKVGRRRSLHYSAMSVIDIQSSGTCGPSGYSTLVQVQLDAAVAWEIFSMFIDAIQGMLAYKERINGCQG